MRAYMNMAEALNSQSINEILPNLERLFLTLETGYLNIIDSIRDLTAKVYGMETTISTKIDNMDSNLGVKLDNLYAKIDELDAKVTELNAKIN
ncbi:uncharacterized protein PRCAT00004128001 [Priceomyces carsonii]|uniref:uncharacterized protein n=1 Tax=Priceomyces carsonii TaxID=28549 RepID=UPI002ED87975|nr:unnamed protein product [Priceomyces carsonii]